MNQLRAFFVRVLKGILLNGLMPLVGAYSQLSIGIEQAVDKASRLYLKKGEPVTPALYSKVHSVRFSNRASRDFLAEVCAATNAGLELGHAPNCDKAIQALQKNSARYSLQFLSDMEVFAISSGLYVLAGEIRKTHVKLLLNRYGNGKRVRPRDAKQLFWCYANRGELEKARQVLVRAGRLYQKYCSADLLGLCVMLGQGDRCHLDTKITKVNDLRFKDYVAGKNVAIIGPSPDPLDMISLRDFPVRTMMGYKGKEYLREELADQPDVDISFYRLNGETRLNMWKGQYEATGFLDDLKFYVINPPDISNATALWPPDNMRSALFFQDGIYFRGGSNMVQMALIDLLHFPVGRVKVFCANFFLSATRYQQNYAGQQQGKSGYDDYRALSNHNLISQYEFVRLLYKNNIIEADAACARVLDLGTDEYLRQMQELQKGAIK